MVVIEILSSLLVLRQKVHSAHWMVIGPNFLELHKHFGALYDNILLQADSVAEYMRTKNAVPPLSLSQVLDYSFVQDGIDTQNPDELVRLIRDDLNMIADQVEKSGNPDRSWTNIADGLHAFLTKESWFLSSYLK